MDRTVCCIASCESVAEEIVARLQCAGYGDDDICVLRPRDRERRPVSEGEGFRRGAAGRDAGALIPAQDLICLESELKPGQIVIAIHTENLAEVEEVEDTFGVAGATGVAGRAEGGFMLGSWSRGRGRRESE